VLLLYSIAPININYLIFLLEETFIRFLKIGKEKNASSIITKYEYWSKIFTLLIDEDSMAGRLFLGWFKHRLKGFRKMKLKVNEGLNI